MSGAREAVLAAVRAANGRVGVEAEARNAWTGLRRGYRRTASLERGAMLELFEERLRDYDAQVVRVQRGGVADAVAQVMTARGKRRMVVPDGVPPGVLPDGFDFVVDVVSRGVLTAAELDAFDGVVTCSTLGIAETGTIVLQSRLGQGRRAISLVPDYHVCVVDAADVVETVPEAMELLAGTSTLPTTFISGPSATADIEMTRIKGVHGPRFLDVILMVEPAGSF